MRYLFICITLLSIFNYKTVAESKSSIKPTERGVLEKFHTSLPMGFTFDSQNEPQYGAKEWDKKTVVVDNIARGTLFSAVKLHPQHDDLVSRVFY